VHRRSDFPTPISSAARTPVAFCRVPRPSLLMIFLCAAQPGVSPQRSRFLAPECFSLKDFSPVHSAPSGAPSLVRSPYHRCLIWFSFSTAGVHLPVETFSPSHSASAEAVKGATFVNCVFPVSGVLVRTSLVLEPPYLMLEFS
jgi:hypothetical protein